MGVVVWWGGGGGGGVVGWGGGGGGGVVGWGGGGSVNVSRCITGYVSERLTQLGAVCDVLQSVCIICVMMWFVCLDGVVFLLCLSCISPVWFVFLMVCPGLCL